MIKEITLKEFTKNPENVVFPKIHAETYDIDHFEIYTWVDIENHLLSIRKRFPTPNGITNYTHFMRFVDQFMIEVNKLKKNFSIKQWKENPLLICYKIIE